MATQRTGDSLVAVIDIWETISNRLGITLKQAADFVEKSFNSHELDLWTDDEYSGLWIPCERQDAKGDDKRITFLLKVWESAESVKWNMAEMQSWQFLRMDEQDVSVIDDRVMRVLVASGKICEANAASDTSLLTNVSQTEQDFDPSDLPFELDAANMAYRAVLNGYGEKSDTFKNRLIDYLQTTCTGLKPEAVQRIATVANPDKSAGRKKTTKE